MAAPESDRPTIRRQLDRSCRTDAELERFCLDYFPQTQALFARGMNRLEKINLLLERENAAELSERLQIYAAQARTPPAQIGRTRSGFSRGIRWAVFLFLGAAAFVSSILMLRDKKPPRAASQLPRSNAAPSSSAPPPPAPAPPQSPNLAAPSTGTVEKPARPTGFHASAKPAGQWVSIVVEVLANEHFYLCRASASCPREGAPGAARNCFASGDPEGDPGDLTGSLRKVAKVETTLTPGTYTLCCEGGDSKELRIMPNKRAYKDACYSRTN